MFLRWRDWPKRSSKLWNLSFKNFKRKRRQALFTDKAWLSMTKASCLTPIKRTTCAGQKRLAALRKALSSRTGLPTTRNSSFWAWLRWSQIWCWRQRLWNKTKICSQKRYKPKTNWIKWCLRGAEWWWTERLKSCLNRTIKFCLWGRLSNQIRL